MMMCGRSGTVLATNDKGRIKTGETATTILAGQSPIATVANAIESALTPSSTALLFQRVRPKHAPTAGLNEALVHESELARNDPAHAGHLPMAYDAGLPR